MGAGREAALGSTLPPGSDETRALAHDLRAAVDGEVRFDASSRAAYASDASNFRRPPIGVVIPRSLDDVIAANEVCRIHRAPMLSRGAGTSLAGQTVNHAVVIDHSKYVDRIVTIDPERRLATVEPGVVTDALNRAAAAHGLTFAPDPATHAYCTMGGNIGNNSCGVHSLQAQFHGDGGRTSDNVHALEVLTADGARFGVGKTPEGELGRIARAGGERGRIYAELRGLRDRAAASIRARYPRMPRRVSGYNLDDLLPERGFDVAAALTGTEGTCVTVLTATVKLIAALPQRALVVLGFDDVGIAAERVPQILAHRPIALEGIDEVLFRDEHARDLHPRALSQLPEGRAWLLVEFGADAEAEAKAAAGRLLEEVERDRAGLTGARLLDDAAQERALWRVREAALAATAFPPGGGDHWSGWEDAAVPPEQLAAYLRRLRALYRRHGYHGALYGHFGQGCVHSRIDFDLRTAAGIARYRSFLEEAADLVVSFGGSLSGEHGDGQQRAELLPKMFGTELVEAFRAFKAIWDPEGRMNPGKVVGPARFDEDLRLSSAPRARPAVRFAYPEDAGDFGHAALRCVGVGACRTLGGTGVMCPSYAVLREETHTTRGRARLLFEMLAGEVITDGWRSDEVKQALDLCLACKGCTAECPVQVDMPTYKAEFLRRYWKGRVRPRHAYALGRIDLGARVAARFPRAAGFVLSTEPFAGVFKRAVGLAAERPAPRVAPVSLRAWYGARRPRNAGGRRVLLWPDTFTTVFRPEAGGAAVEALEAAGWHVTMPRAPLCCGRPLYDYGFVDRAARALRRILDELRAEIRAGTPVVGIEPSCVATFKHELPRLFPDDDDAARLRAQTYHFAEFFGAYGIEPPSLRGRALLWGHCHQKATGGMAAEEQLLRGMGLEVQTVVGGCCGLAGGWGYEREHHALSMACGEQALLPAVRAAPIDTVVVAGGFSCATQIEHGATGRRALHPAQVIVLARTYGPVLGPRPETLVRGLVARPQRRNRGSAAGYSGK